MVEISDIEIYRDGGTIEFRVSGSTVDGFYRLQTPFLGFPQPLFRDGTQVPFGAAVEAGVLQALRTWLATEMTEQASTALAELDQMPLWHNLPERLDQVVPLHYVRRLVQRLDERVRA